MLIQHTNDVLVALLLYQVNSAVCVGVLSMNKGPLNEQQRHYLHAIVERSADCNPKVHRYD